MRIKEVKKLFEESLYYFCSGMSEIQLKQVEGLKNYEPIKDLFLDNDRLTSHKKMSVDNCLDFLQKFYENLTTAEKHENLSGNIDYITITLCDIIADNITHDFSGSLVNCAWRLKDWAYRLLRPENIKDRDQDECDSMTEEFLHYAEGVFRGEEIHPNPEEDMIMLNLELWMENLYWETVKDLKNNNSQTNK